MSEEFPNLCNALIVFSKQHRWAIHLIQKLSLRYHITTMVADDVFFDGGSKAVEYCVAKLIKENKINVVFLDTEFLPVVDTLVISSIPDGVLRVLLAFDDVLQHETNLHHALSCHAVLTADPVSVQRFWQRGIPAHLICLEGSASLYFPDRKATAVHDVLFFGDANRGDRPKWLAYLAENGIEVFMPSSNSLSYEELARYIRSARIVLNFSKVGAAPYSPLMVTESAPYLYFKGRIVEAGLSGVPCLSEIFPGAETMFGEGVLQCFSTPEECLQQIRNLLADERRRASLGDALYECCIERYADGPQSQSIANFLSGCPVRQPGENYANAVYCAGLLARKIFRLLPHSPLLASREVFRLISRRIFRGGVSRNFTIVISLTMLTILCTSFHFFLSRYSQFKFSQILGLSSRKSS